MLCSVTWWLGPEFLALTHAAIESEDFRGNARQLVETRSEAVESPLVNGDSEAPIEGQSAVSAAASNTPSPVAENTTTAAQDDLDAPFTAGVDDLGGGDSDDELRETGGTLVQIAASQLPTAMSIASPFPSGKEFTPTARVRTSLNVHCAKFSATGAWVLMKVESIQQSVRRLRCQFAIIMTTEQFEAKDLSLLFRRSRS